VYREPVSAPCRAQSANIPRGEGFLRYYGRAVFDDDPALFRKACEQADYISKLYNEKNGRKLRMFCLSEATAEFRNLTGIQESLSM